MDYHIFNLAEALFWISLGLSGYVLRNVKGRGYEQLAIYGAIVFVAFGLSDVAEIVFGSFLDPDRVWLLIWKVINVFAIVYGLLWYLHLRIRQ